MSILTHEAHFFNGGPIRDGAQSIDEPPSSAPATQQGATSLPCRFLSQPDSSPTSGVLISPEGPLFEALLEVYFVNQLVEGNPPICGPFGQSLRLSRALPPAEGVVHNALNRCKPTAYHEGKSNE